MMDLLFTRYASPFSLLDQMLENGSFSDYIDYMFDAYTEEKDWEFYINKDIDMSFTDFRDSLKVQAVQRQTPEADLETAVIESRDILSNFTPHKEGEHFEPI